MDLPPRSASSSSDPESFSQMQQKAVQLSVKDHCLPALPSKVLGQEAALSDGHAEYRSGNSKKCVASTIYEDASGPVLFSKTSLAPKLLGAHSASVDDLTQQDHRHVLNSTTAPGSKSASLPMSFSRKFESPPSNGSLASLFEEDEISLTPSHTAEYQESPSKRHKSTRSTDMTEVNPLFLSKEEAAESSEEELDTKQDNTSFSGKKEVVDSIKDEMRVPKVKTPRKRIIQQPKIRKFGVARAVVVVNQSDVDHTKIKLDFNAWKERERIEKRGVATLDPMQMYLTLRNSIGSEVDEDEDATHTVTQVVLMALSLGNSQSIVRLKCIMKEMRCITRAAKYLDPIKIVGEEGDEKLDAETRSEREKERRVKLTRAVLQSTFEKTVLENFEDRYSSTNLCEYIVARRDDLIRQSFGRRSPSEVMQSIYRELIIEMEPKISQHTRDKGKSRLMVAVEQLENRVKRGFRWLALRELFGVGILAIQYHGQLFSETSRLSIDDALSDVESEMLIKYIQDRENAHYQWLRRLCNLINGHVQAGATGMLRQPPLVLEGCTVGQITQCQEHSDELLQMCQLAN